MKAKLIYTTFMSLLIGSGISNAADRLALTYGKEPSNQLTPYQTTSNPCLNKALTDENVDFSNASQQKVKLTYAISPTDNVQIEGMIRYVGEDMYGLPYFMEYIQSCVAQYKPGMKLSAEKEIVLSTEDSINMATFARYALQNLFSSIKREQTVTPAFKDFTHKRKAPFGNFTYDNNSILFSLMYYFDDAENASSQEPIEIVNFDYKYNNLKFKFSPCPTEQKDKGKKIEGFSFNANDIPFNSFVKLHPNTKDTIAKDLSTSCSLYPAIYQFTSFKVGEDLYRIRVLLSSQESLPNFYSGPQEYVDRKVANFILTVK